MELFSHLDISDHLSAFLAQGPLLAFLRVGLGKSINYVYRSAILFARKRGDEAGDSFSARVVRLFSSLSLSRFPLACIPRTQSIVYLFFPPFFPGVCVLGFTGQKERGQSPTGSVAAAVTTR